METETATAATGVETPTEVAASPDDVTEDDDGALDGPPRLAVADDGRYLVDERSGEPFPWVGDTAWRLARSLDREEVTRYLEDRAAKGFSVVQVVAFDRLDGDWTNPFDEPPLATRGPDEPATINEAYLEHVDHVLDEAARLGLVVAMAPDFMRISAPEDVYDADDARRMGEVLGERYADRDGLVWILGGDTDPTGLEDLVLAWVEGLDAGDGGRHLMTYHATGSRGLSSRFWADADWLDFHAIQSTHTEPCRTTWEHVTTDYERESAAEDPKPTIDIEPPYEDHPIDWEPVERGRFAPPESRRSAYWQLLAGSAGHTYGHNSIWRFASGPAERDRGSAASMSWRDALDSPGAEDMTHLRALLETRPVIGSVPDQSLILSGQADEDDPCGHVRASRTADGGHVFVYTPRGEPVEVDLTVLDGDEARAWWYDPRTGEAVDGGTADTGDGSATFTPPETDDPFATVEYGPAVGEVEYGTDWLLVLDAADAAGADDLPAPGAGTPFST